MTGTFERYFAGAVAEPATLPRADAARLADTGQGLEAAALEAAGGSLEDVAGTVLKWNKREGNSQYDIARGQALQRIGKFERTPYADSDALKAGQKKLEQDLSAIPTTAKLNNKSGQSLYSSWLTNSKEKRTRLSAEKEIRLVFRGLQLNLFNNLTEAAKITDAETARKEINLIVQGGLDDGTIKTADKALMMRKTFMDNWQRVDVWRRATTQLRADGEGGTEIDWTAAADWFNQPENIKDLPESIVEDFSDTARANKNAQTAADKENSIKLQEAEKQSLASKLFAGDLEDSRDVIDSVTSPLSAGDKIVWDKRFRDEAERINKGTKIVTDNPTFIQLDSAVLGISTGARTRNDVQELIINSRDRLSNEDYRSLGLKLNVTHSTFIARSIADARRYGSTQILKRDPLTSRLIGSADDEQSLREYNLDMDSMIEASQKAGKELEAKDIIRFSRDLALIHRKTPQQKQRATVSDRKGLTLKRAAARRRVKIELDRLKQLGTSPAGLENIWNGLNSAERETAITAIDQGKTAEEINRFFKNIEGE